MNKSYLIHKVILTTIFFSGSALFSEENNKYYISLIIGICVLSAIYTIIRVEVLKLTFTSVYTWWLIGLFTFYLYYGIFLPKYRGFNTDIFLFIPIVLINVIVWFIDIPIEKSITILINSCTYAAILLIVFIIYKEFDIIKLGTERIGSSAGGNVNNVGLYFGTYSMCILYGYLFEKRKRYLLLYLIVLTFMFLTGSRKSILFLLVGHGMLFMLSVKANIKKYLIPLLSITLIFNFLLTNDYFYNIIGIRILSFLRELGFNLTNVDTSISTYDRKMMIVLGWKAFIQNPIFGNGWQYFSYFARMNMYSHNNYIELLVNYGLVGLIFSYIMYLYVLKKLYRNLSKDKYRILLFSMLMVILVVDFASVTFYESPRYYIILFFAFLYVRRRGTQKKQQKSNLHLGGRTEKSIDFNRP